MKKINLFEAFSGIGSQHLALKNLGFKVNLIGISDWYIDAIIAYSITHLNLKPKKINKNETISFLKQFSLSRDSKKPLKSFAGINDKQLSILEQVIKKFGKLDINHISGKDLVGKNIDLFTYSFPCQDISQQGKKAGFSKNCNTRSGLLWQIERILKEIKKLDKASLPKVLLLENVKALLNKEFKNDLNAWLKELENLGYKSTKPFIIDALDIGEAQKRQRVFIVSMLEKQPKDFLLQKTEKQKFLKNIIENNLSHEKLDLNSKNIELIHNFGQKNIGIKKGFLKNYTSFNAENYFYYLDNFAPTITASGAQSRIKFFNPKDSQIYFLNALEHLKLQGFNKSFYTTLKEFGFTENKIKFLAGNSINIKVLEEIFKFYL